VTVRALLLDYNGTLADDEPLLASIYERLFAEAGVPYTRERYWAELAGYSDPEIVARVLEAAGRGGEGALAQRLLGRRTELYLETVAREPPIRPGAAALVRAAAARVPVGVVSGAQRAEVEAALRASGLRPLLDPVVTAEDVERGKPAPDGYLRGLTRLGERLGDDLPAAAVLAIEDSPQGVAAALAAGLRCIALAGTAGAERLGAAERVVDGLSAELVEPLLDGAPRREAGRAS
jgi:beta-phosphoglucomutase